MWLLFASNKVWRQTSELNVHLHATVMGFTFEFIVFCDNLERIFGLVYHNLR